MFEMIDILKKIFAANPGKSMVKRKENSLDCGREIIVNITSTAGGYGFQGAFLSSVHLMRMLPSVLIVTALIQGWTIPNERRKVKGKRVKGSKA